MWFLQAQSRKSLGHSLHSEASYLALDHGAKHLQSVHTSVHAIADTESTANAIKCRKTLNNYLKRTNKELNTKLLKNKGEKM